MDFFLSFPSSFSRDQRSYEKRINYEIFISNFGQKVTFKLNMKGSSKLRQNVDRKSDVALKWISSIFNS